MWASLDKAQKPLQKLEKLIGSFPADPSPEDVHILRTQARRLEATVHALSSQSDADARRLLKIMKPLRKAAGDVRDLDVLIGKVFTLAEAGAGRGADESLVRLTEHMAMLRKRRASHLHRVVKRRRKEALRLLKKYRKQMDDPSFTNESPTLAGAEVLVAELEHWPRLQAANLHEFRIRAKELRYILQLTPGVDDRRMDAFARMKDASGEWHDWLELKKLAESELEPNGDRAILQRIAAIARGKLRVALSAANALRKNGLGAPGSS